jgi:pimeloyl-ACP methyl ester carboxylesterase
VSTTYPRRLPVQIEWGTADGCRFVVFRGRTNDPRLAPVVSMAAFGGESTVVSGFSHFASLSTGRTIVEVLGGACWGSDAPANGAYGIDGITVALDALGYTTGNVMLRGVSMGGLNALAWAAAHPDRVGAMAVYVPALSLEYMWDNASYRSSVEAAWGTSGKSATMAASADADPYRNMGDYSDFGDRVLLLADTADTDVGYARQVEFADTIGATFVQSVGLGHGLWPIGDAYDEFDQVRTWALAP